MAPATRAPPMLVMPPRKAVAKIRIPVSTSKEPVVSWPWL